MNYKRILISEAEKKRILGMHNNRKKNPTTNNFLFEDDSTTAGCEACNATPPEAGDVVQQVQKWYFINGACEEKTGGDCFSSLQECENCNCGGGNTQDQTGGNTQEVTFSECLTTPGYREITGQELLDNYGERFPCIQAAAAVIDPQSKFVTVAEGTINKYGLYVYSSNPKVCVICKQGSEEFEIRPYGCSCVAGRYKTVRGNVIDDPTNFTPMEDNPKTKAECKPVGGDNITKDKNCKNLSPSEVAASFGLRWSDVSADWIANNCYGTTPCKRGSYGTNINIRNAMCDGTYDPKNPQEKNPQKGGTIPGDQTPTDGTKPEDQTQTPTDGEKRFIEPIFPGDEQTTNTPVAD